MEDVINPWDSIRQQQKERKDEQDKQLDEKLREVLANREDYCDNLKVNIAISSSVLDIKGLTCKALAPHASCKPQSLSPDDIEKLCSKRCHECPCYTDYKKFKRTNEQYLDCHREDDEYYGDSDIIEPVNAKMSDIEAYYEHLMKEGYSYYDEEKLAEFYNKRPSIDRYNRLVLAFKSSGLKAGDYLSYAIPCEILKERLMKE